MVAIEEAHDTPPAARPAVRRNIEAAIKTLSDMAWWLQWPNPAFADFASAVVFVATVIFVFAWKGPKARSILAWGVAPCTWNPRCEV